MRGILLLTFAACGATVSPPAPRAPVVLADAGSAPRFALQYAIPDGSSHAIQRVFRVNTATVMSTGELTRHGDTLEMRAQGGVHATAPLDASGYLDERFVLPRLPEVPVGAGASWSYDVSATDLIPAPHHHVVTVDNVTATTVHWQDVDTVSEPRQHHVVAGKDWDVALSGQGVTDVSIDLAAFTVDVTGHFSLTIDGTVDARPRHLTFETTKHITMR